MKSNRSTFLNIRGLRTHVREWGRPGAPLLVLLHGWMDMSASFQFLVDALAGDWHVVAPDWRGFGLTQRSTGFPGTDSYWFPDYLADLDAVLLHYAGTSGAVHLVGHSLGGNVACIYAGVRPQRVRTLVSLDGPGLPATRPDQAPRRYAQWLDQQRTPETMRNYATREAVARRLSKNNPRLTAQRADFLAAHWAAETPAGDFEILGDPVHKHVNPILYRVDEVLACWRAVAAPVLWVTPRESELLQRWAKGDLVRLAELRREFGERLRAFADLREVVIDDAGHMLHHDQPERCASVIEEFIAACDARPVAA